MFTLDQFQLTDPDKLLTEVEHKTTFTLNRCEFNIFETHRKAENVKLRFGGFTITSMLRGTKLIHENEEKAFRYIPGQTLMLPSTEDMVIDFPEAHHASPTQCTALVIEEEYLQKQVDYINEHFTKEQDGNQEWKLNPNHFFLQNDEQIAQLGNKLIKVFSGTDPLKDIIIDIKLKELILSIMRLQNLNEICNDKSLIQPCNERFKAVIEYIRRNITGELNIQQLSKLAYMSKSSFYRTFTNEFGVSPNQMILLEKINIAKQLMMSGNRSIKDVCFSSGFSDPNYFCRVFKKYEGRTPGEYLRGVSTHS